MGDPPAWSVVVPVKRTEVAKSRLGGALAPARRDLALAFAADTVAAALACPRVTGVVVVTDDADAAARLVALGAVTVGDEPHSGLNPALQHGATRARAQWPQVGVALLSADLPALRPDDLRRALDAAAAHPRAFVCDVAGTGTTLVTAAPTVAVVSAFGPRSRARHRDDGVVEIDLPDLATVRRDVDTEVDLADAVRMGVGPATRAVLARVASARGPAG
jgi:2-phospho-L-lactate guanylyltransferase